ncbi:hypothetical protein DFH94DRAFT_847988 [Russula ochroleuca]|uniref:Uncharacterized protein n=1 Tax=Russula ochroleuca TaxID=152965 RepID=A0A9P5JWR1_9AGAM|nr:hypothetical protein DFH94DRAFT_847988 [Russula ochroleuca]
MYCLVRHRLWSHPRGDLIEASSPGYDERLPDFNNHLVVALSTVAGPHQGASGGAVTFPASISESVRGGVKDSTLLQREHRDGKLFLCQASATSFATPATNSGSPKRRKFGPHVPHQSDSAGTSAGRTNDEI